MRKQARRGKTISTGCIATFIAHWDQRGNGQLQGIRSHTQNNDTKTELALQLRREKRLTSSRFPPGRARVTRVQTYFSVLPPLEPLFSYTLPALLACLLFVPLVITASIYLVLVACHVSCPARALCPLGIFLQQACRFLVRMRTLRLRAA